MTADVSKAVIAPVIHHFTVTIYSHGSIRAGIAATPPVDAKRLVY